MILEDKPYMILLSSKKGGKDYQIQFSSTGKFLDAEENECKEAFEEMVHELRQTLHEKFALK